QRFPAQAHRARLVLHLLGQDAHRHRSAGPAGHEYLDEDRSPAEGLQFSVIDPVFDGGVDAVSDSGSCGIWDCGLRLVPFGRARMCGQAARIARADSQMRSFLRPLVEIQRGPSLLWAFTEALRRAVFVQVPTGSIRREYRDAEAAVAPWWLPLSRG